MLLRALNDLVCASSACPDDIDPANGWEITDVHVRVYSPENRFSMAIAHRVTPEADPVLTKETAFHPRTSELTRSFVEYRGYWLPPASRARAPWPSTGPAARRRRSWTSRRCASGRSSGPTPRRWCSATITRDAARLAVGQVVYTAVCNETGGMIDDATVFRLGPTTSASSAATPTTACTSRSSREREALRVWVKPTTDELHNIAVQGPRSRDILARSSGAPTQPALEELKWFRFLVGRIGDYDGIP